MKKNLILIVIFLGGNIIFAHNVSYEKQYLREWSIDGISFNGTFLLNRNDSVFIENSNHNIMGFPIYMLKGNDKLYVSSKINKIKDLNKQLSKDSVYKKHSHTLNNFSITIIPLLLICLVSYALFFRQTHKFKFMVHP